MEKFLEKAVRHVNSVFPSIYNTREKRGSYHFCLAYERNTLVAAGVNNPVQVNAKSFQFAQKLGLTHKLQYPYTHAEEDLVGRLIGLGKLDSSLKIVILRLNRFYELGNSYPCSNCREVLSAYGLGRVYYSTSCGLIEQL